MGATATKTLNWQDIISGWTFSCAGEAPHEGLAESVVPAVERTNDGLFEITTISFGFSGTAPYHRQKFTAEFSFSGNARSNTQGFLWNSPSIDIDGRNWIEIYVEADDEATITAGPFSRKAALHNPVEFNSGWIREAPAHFLPESQKRFSTEHQTKPL